MRVRRLKVHNFRGVDEGTVDFSGHTLLVGGNNVGKSTVCEALDLVLGPERLFRKPVVDEHDFHLGRYLDDDNAPTEIRIEAILVDLSEEAQRRFAHHLRRWDEQTGTFVDEGDSGPEAGDEPATSWALPVIFIGKYDRDEDDFVGDTFFSHPEPVPEETETEEEEESRLGGGLDRFSRVHKRMCGYLFLRALRTGSRALSLQRGSLLDTVLRLGAGGLADMWEDTLKRLRELDPAIGDIPQLQQVSTEIKARMARFVDLAQGKDATAFFASELTREHLRDVVRFFVSAEPCAHPLPFNRLGTGSINVLVFALLTFIAELKEKQSVIFAMEEPEIALPPHTQRRVTRFVLREMGQAIVTSHSPYVIEQFEPQQITILDRTDAGTLTGKPIDLKNIKPKAFSKERRQFAEAVLSRAVLVVEGHTEAAIFPVASAVMEAALGPEAYCHLDQAGISVFNAGSDSSVPKYGPIFRALGKPAFCFHDKPTVAFSAEALQQLSEYVVAWESPQKTIERVLVKETPGSVLRRFLKSVKDRADHPSGVAKIAAGMSDADVSELAEKVLLARKGDAGGYGALLIEQCKGVDELPETIRGVLEAIHRQLSPTVPTGG
jgi:putative ATP-dependent endonuclease of OLD family